MGAYQVINNGWEVHQNLANSQVLDCNALADLTEY